MKKATHQIILAQSSYRGTYSMRLTFNVGSWMTHFVPMIIFFSPASVCARPSFNYCHWLAIIRSRRPCVSWALNTIGIGRHKTHSVGVVIPLFHSIPFHRSIPPFHSIVPFRWIKTPENCYLSEDHSADPQISFILPYALAMPKGYVWLYVMSMLMDGCVSVVSSFLGVW